MQIPRLTLTSMLVLTTLTLASIGVRAQNNVADAPSGRTAVVTKTKPTPPWVSFTKDGLLFTNKDKSDQLKINGYVQGDGRFFSSDLQNQSPDKLLWRRIRPNFEGTLFNFLDFRFMPDFGQNTAQVQDLYVEVKTLPFLKPRVGKFKTPQGLEALRQDQFSDFVERSLASDLVPLREVGAQLGGSVLANTISYSAGYFNGAPDGSNGNFVWRTSNEGAARIFLQPFLASKIAPLQGIGVGLAGSFANEHGTLPSYKTIGQNSFFKYNKASAGGQHNRITPQAWYYAGPLGIITEYTKSSQEVVSSKDVIRRLANEGWQAAGSLFLTGEKNSYKGTIQPKYSFEPNRGIRYFGAWELVGRVSALRVDPSAFPLFADPRKSAQAASEWVVGVNWFPNRYLKIMNDYAHTNFDMASRTATPLHSENVIMTCIQLAF